MLFVTGDTHGRFERFWEDPILRNPALSREDRVLICGDFGGLWSGGERDERLLDRLATLPFTVLFADGNHENYDLLEAGPTQLWHGGQVRFLRDNVVHLRRGQVFRLEGRRIFVMGGAACHDIQAGVQDLSTREGEYRCLDLYRRGVFFRIRGLSWWERELPSPQELEAGRHALRREGMEVDYVISHCAPGSVQRRVSQILDNDTYPENHLTAFLDEVLTQCRFQHWYCGHYHTELDLGKVHVRYRSIERLF